MPETPTMHSRYPLQWALLPLGIVFIWLSIIFFINELTVSFLVLVRGKGLAEYTADFNLISPTTDHYLWLLILTSILLLSLIQNPFSKMMSDWRTTTAGTLLIASLLAYLLDFRALAYAITIPAMTMILYPSILAAAQSNNLSKRRVVGISVGLFLLFPLAVELIASARWILNSFDGVQPFSDPSWDIALPELKMVNFLQPLLPRLFVLFSAAWVLSILFIPFEGNAETLAARIFNKKALFNRPNSTSDIGAKSTPQMILGLSVITALFLGLYPYIPTLNPSSKLVGVDVNFYYSNMKNALNMDPAAILTSFFRQDRSIYLTLQQAVEVVTGSPDLTIRVMPAILGALLTVSTYILVSSTGSNNKKLAALAALFTATSFQLVAGINAGFYANWLALTEINIFLTLIIKALDDKHGSWKYPVLSTAVSVGILFTHSATWEVLMASLVIYAVAAFVRKTLGRRDVVVITQIILAGIAFDLLRNTLLQNTSTVGVAAAMTPNISYTNILTVFNALTVTFTSFLGGAYANPLILILATIGLVLITKSKQKFHQLLLAITIVCITGTFFTSSTMPDLLQSRFIYLIPFQILAAITLNTFINVSTSIFNEKTGRIGKVIPLMLLITIFAALLSYALRVIGFIYTV